MAVFSAPLETYATDSHCLALPRVEVDVEEYHVCAREAARSK
jgi:hypothetical protein